MWGSSHLHPPAGSRQSGNPWYPVAHRPSELVLWCLRPWSGRLSIYLGGDGREGEGREGEGREEGQRDGREPEREGARERRGRRRKV